MPNIVNTSRPPSATTVPGPNGGRPTTTSRRGGRTRSRSPPIVNGRMSVNESSLPVGDNPSSAAAAAAAAAKAYSNGSSGRQGGTWPENGGGREESSYHGYEKPYNSSNWPASDGRGHYRYPAGPGGYGEPYPMGPGHYRSSEERANYREQSHRHHYDGDRNSNSRGMQQRGRFPQDYRYNHAREAARASPNATSTRGTSLVIGGTTPIHVPKPADALSPHLQRGGSAASVFRGRPGNDANRGLEDDSAQKILLSLRTPTTSFDDRNGAKKSSPLPLSPVGDTQVEDPKSSDPLLEPHRTADVKLSGSIENAPSFSLFNQSFDSFGDGHYFNVDSSLQNDSFGMGRTHSVDQETAAQLLQSTSVGFPHQLLGSGSGALTIGYSPVNSFGNMSGSGTRRTGNMLLVGGSDTRPASPTQVLGVYRSYSGGGGSTRPGPLDDGLMRMSVGSPSAQPMPFSRPYAEPGPSPNYYYPGPIRSPEGSDKTPLFYTFLRRHRGAFKDCVFLLPGLKAALLEAPLNDDGEPNSPSGGTNSVAGQSMYGDPAPHDAIVARRRVDSSVYAFGGNPSRERPPQTLQDKNSIFRGRESKDKLELATVTPSSATSTPANRYQMRVRSKYEADLTGRYYENESRLSWEFEENPPVEIIQDDDDYERGDGLASLRSSGNDDSKSVDQLQGDGDGKGSDGDASGSRAAASPPAPKMRYRCKLCGQPKQNHTCPYQQSLARSIGVMVYPAVNSFAACEPGTVAPALSDMNNFIDSQREMGSTDSSPSRPTPDRLRRPTTGGTPTATTQVTPESMRSSPRQLHSPGSFGLGSGQPLSRRSIGRPAMVHFSGRKRPYSGVEEQNDLLFMESMELKPEQFRLVSPLKSLNSPDAFSYPSLALPYAQRKRLSDNLFSLSNEVPKLTDECAQVLREAREKDMWDLAVAELMTQVVVIIHCPEGDSRFEGLRQYLITLGIAC